MQPQEEKKSLEDIPRDLPILPLRNTVALPFMILPLSVGVPRSIKLVEDTMHGNRLIGLVTSKDPDLDEPVPGQTYTVGTVARVLRVVRGSDKDLQIVVENLERFKILHWQKTEPYLQAHIELAPDAVETGLELDALVHSLRELAKQVVALMPNLPAEVSNFLDQVQEPRYLFYMVTSNSRMALAECQRILEIDDLKDKYRAVIAYLTREKEILTLGKKIQSEARQKMDKDQREYYLRQQLKAIQKELGEAEDTAGEAAEYADRIDKTDMPEEARKEALRELKRFKGMPPQSAEYSVIKTYLDWLLDLPWDVLSEDQLDINHARAVLDEDHYDLLEVKDRIVEFLAVRKLVRERGLETQPGEDEKAGEAMGAILCFVGPPGVGKTSLGQSIARALGRKFTRMSLGGMRDEAEIRGHRRTYIGALPGRIIQAIKRAGTRNPVFMLDEVDKIGTDWRGDPSSALLEVLDPAQNHAFRDHYLDVDFDLSDVMFITTANQLETIPAPLRDRMEIIQLEGYTEYEKIHIARNFLIPRQLKANGLMTEEISMDTDALHKIIRDYTREAGVRTLERQIGSIFRKIVVKIAGGEITRQEITPQTVLEFLKKEKFEAETSETFEIPGIATGLAVTATGGDILFIEAARMSGKGKLTLTGQLGDVMRESAQIAHSYVRSKAAQWNIEADEFEKTEVHLHVPAGAIPKDGPSAGIAMVTAIASLFSGRPVRGDVGMTGEVTLRGRVMPIGGVKMKVLAAHRARLTTVILPQKNERDLEDLPDEIRQTMSFVPVDQIDQALEVALASEKREK
ncbi:MAG: endopeptidase La [Deltaproteobacteria bacterium]|nr:endopeptidase La [Deltaproteobacteria bacterium]